MDIEEVRNRLNEYITNNGIKAKYIADMFSIDVTVFSRFRSGKRRLNMEQLEQLWEFLSKE